MWTGRTGIGGRVAGHDEGHRRQTCLRSNFDGCSMLYGIEKFTDLHRDQVDICAATHTRETSTRRQKSVGGLSAASTTNSAESSDEPVAVRRTRVITRQSVSAKKSCGALIERKIRYPQIERISSQSAIGKGGVTPPFMSGRN